MGRPRQQARRRASSWLTLFGWSAPLLFVCWVVFAGDFDKWDLLAGVAAALMGAVAICVVERADNSHFLPRLRDWIQVVWVPWLLVQGTYEIVVVSFRDLMGGRPAASAFRTATFRAGSPDDPRDTGRRVLAVTYTTMAPNFIVLGINADDHLVFHQIERSSVPAVAQNLGAQA